MKNHPLILRSKGILAALLGAAAPLAMAEPAGRTTGTVPDSPTVTTFIPVSNPARLVATIRPLDASFTTRGDLVFFMVGDAVTIIGRITGLEPNKRHQAVVRLPLYPLSSQLGRAEPALEVDLGMMVSDAHGIANLSASILRKDLGLPPSGVQGCTVVIKRAPPLDSREERNPVGAGTIVPAGPVVPVAAGP